MRQHGQLSLTALPSEPQQVLENDSAYILSCVLQRMEAWRLGYLGTFEVLLTSFLHVIQNDGIHNKDPPSQRTLRWTEAAIIHRPRPLSTSDAANSTKVVPERFR